MKTLLFITNTYPFERGETFIENEIPFIDKSFDRIIFIPTNVKNFDGKRNIGTKGEIMPFPKHAGIGNAVLLCVEFLKLLFSADLYREISDTKRLAGTLKHVLSWVPRWVSYRVRTHLFEQDLKKILKKEDSVYIYSYWFSFHALIGTELLKNDSRVIRRLSRGHRFDLYVRAGSYPPLHRYLLKNLDHVLTCSRQGAEYIQKQIPEYAEKVYPSLLGTNDYGEQPYVSSPTFRLVSCSNLYAIKRVDRIIDALALLDIPVEWTHFGDGPLEGELKKTAQTKLAGKQIKVTWRGRLSNPDLMKEYGKSTFDLFANVSDSEGLPVSIMEAMSFGIPCFVTDVGGSAEIASKETTQLVSPVNAVRDLAAYILKLHTMPKEEIRLIRSRIRMHWKNNFSASSNYEKFLLYFSDEKK